MLGFGGDFKREAPGHWRAGRSGIHDTLDGVESEHFDAHGPLAGFEPGDAVEALLVGGGSDAAAAGNGRYDGTRNGLAAPSDRAGLDGISGQGAVRHHD